MSKSIKFAAMALSLCVVTGLGAGCSDVEELKTPVFKTNLAPDEIRTSAFKDDFPAHYDSYMRNEESSVMTEYKGSVNFMKNDDTNGLPEGYKHAQPYLKNLWLGYAFMYEYREARGHTHAVSDFLEIDRINRYGSEKGGLPATCWNCKTPKMIEWVKEYGDDFWTKDVNEFRDKIDAKDHSITCATCHDPVSMDLRITSVPLNDYLKTQGIDPATISRNDMRSLACAQCHVEYYFNNPSMGVNKKPVFPWGKGKNAEDMYAYYDTIGDCTIPGFEGKFADWVHPVSQTPMLKAQHPEYEMWSDGIHGAAGVSCADCHMSYTRTEDKKKISSHWWTAPLKDPNLTACRQCHSDKSADYLRGRVIDTQNKCFEQLMMAQDLSVKAHEAVRLASEYEGEKPENYDQLMIDAREMVRKGQFFWDYVSAENSVGFHNPTKTLTTLAKSQQYSAKAVEIANRAANFTLSAVLDGDIKEIVPPILTLNRELQQDPEFMKSHKWLEYLPVSAPADKYWEFQEPVGKK